MSRESMPSTIATIGIDIGKNTVNISRCLIGMEACSGAHHIGRQLEALGHGTFRPSRSEPWKRSRRSALGSDSGRWKPLGAKGR
jgi:hypothetical protein